MGVVNNNILRVYNDQPRNGAKKRLIDADRLDRVLVFLVPTLHIASFRLGRSCEVKYSMNTGPDESAGHRSRSKASGIYAAMIVLYVELFRLGKLAQETLYSSASCTKELIQSGKYHEAVRHIVALFEVWDKNLENTEGRPHVLSACCQAWELNSSSLQYTELTDVRASNLSLSPQTSLLRHANVHPHNCLPILSHASSSLAEQHPRDRLSQ